MFALFNTTTEKVEGYQSMTFIEAGERNDSLRNHYEPVRWVPTSDLPETE